jgi:membrane associated rhomboid family serine protease
MIIIPVGVDYEASRYPVVTFSIMGLCTVIFAGQLAAIASGVGSEIYMNFGLVPAQHGFWAWITNLFLHGGFFHLVGNMIYLFLFGSCIEDTIGRGKFVAFYLIGGLIANII